MTVVVPALEKVLLQEMDALKRGKGKKKTGAEQKRIVLSAQRKQPNQFNLLKKYVFMTHRCIFNKELLAFSFAFILCCIDLINPAFCTVRHLIIGLLLLVFNFYVFQIECTVLQEVSHDDQPKLPEFPLLESSANQGFNSSFVFLFVRVIIQSKIDRRN